MQFRRSSVVLSAQGRLVARAPTPLGSPRRSHRRLVVLTGLLIAAGAAIVDRVWTRAEGVVAGELTAVSPIVPARLQNLFVHCLDHVSRGQRVAEFTNEATVEAADQQAQQLQLLLKQARAEAVIAKQEASAAAKVVEAQAAVLQQLVSVRDAESDLAKKQFVAALVYDNAKSAVVRGEADKAAAEFLFQGKLAELAKAELAADVLAQRIDSYRNAAELTGHFFLTAPKDGTVTECTAHVGEVIAAKTPIFQIFNPDDAYAIVFFDPADLARLQIGQGLDLRITGLPAAVAGRIGGFYPELSALPSDLTRYFWQQERWSQYAPVRVDIAGLNGDQKQRLAAWAQLSVSVWKIPPAWIEAYQASTAIARQWASEKMFGARRRLAQVIGQ